MFVTEISIDGEMVVRPTWQFIETAIRSLNGSTRSLVILGVGKEVPHMAVGGGRHDCYVVYTTGDNAAFNNLISRSQGDGSVVMTVGGQEAEYPRRECACLADALLAAKAFTEAGVLDGRLDWIKS